MPICKTILFVGLIAMMTGTSALAFDPDAVFGDDERPSTVLRYGVEALKGGRMDDAIGAFSFGAKNEHLASEWKLARMMETGDGVAADPIAAFRLYTRIADRFAKRTSSRLEAPYVAAALVSLGRYFLTGIEGEVRLDPWQAEGRFYRAAALYRDADAQYQLGKLYRSDSLGAPQTRSAVRWLGLAARKGHPEALAELGQMLFTGDGVQRSRIRGLVYLARAVAARPSGMAKGWHEKAVAEASEAERIAAADIASQWSDKPEERTFGLATDGVLTTN